MSGRALALILLSLTGCAGGGETPGAAAVTAERAYAECRDLARSALRTDAAIDQDIAASRSSDIQRADSVRSQTRQMAETTHARTTAIIASCMKAKGLAPGW